MAVSQMVGAKIHRREDPRLVSGHGRYIDDITIPGVRYAAFVRSPHPHARVKRISSEAALSVPGVSHVLTAADFRSVLAGTHPVAPAFVAEKKTVPERFPIASDEVTYEGEVVAVVVAADRAAAADGALAVEVEYELLPVVQDLRKALEPDSPKAHTGLPDNVAWDLTYTPEDLSAEAFANAEVVVSRKGMIQQRLAPASMEPRGVAASWDPWSARLDIWISSQNPHFIRLFVAGALGLGESAVHVLSPDVGGGFGSKISPYPEDYLVPATSKLLGFPVKWIESRSENVVNTTHGRGQEFDVELAGRRDGTITGIRVTQYLDAGAYVGTFGAFQACACLLISGAYDVKAVSARTVGVLTNRVPTDPYRGAGRPEATFAIERMIDIFAAEIGVDPVEVRRKNFIRSFPYTNTFGLTYDSGDYEKSLAQALELIGYEDFRREQQEARARGRYLGIGVSTWIEICGFGPSAATAPATGGLALVEAAQVRVTPTGNVIAYTGTHGHGQGHDTTFSQILADVLGVPYESIELRHGDTSEGTSFGYGTYGSRSLAVGGMALRKAGLKVIDKARRMAAHVLEAAEEDIEFTNGAFRVKGSPDRSKTLAELAFPSYGAGLPEDYEHGLEATAYFDPPNFVWPFGAHIAVVEVDPETGQVKLLRYAAVDDCGTVINPLIVEGQIHGGIAQGMAQALFEEVVYDRETGNLKTGSFVDYLIPTANEIPDSVVLGSTVTPSPSNEMGVKGIGEAGTIASTPAFINAICDALSPFGIRHVEMPASPDKLWKMMQEVRA